MPKRQRGNRVAQIDECRVANHQERIIAGRGLDCSIQRVRPFEFNRLYRQTQCCCLVPHIFHDEPVSRISRIEQNRDRPDRWNDSA